MSAVAHSAEFSQGPNDKDTKKKLKQKPSSGEEYELSRFKPALRTVLEVVLPFTILLRQLLTSF